MKAAVEDLKDQLKLMSIEESIRYLYKTYSGRIGFSTSFGQEDQVITHIVRSHGLPVEIFSLDTGRLFPETYEVQQLTEEKYGFKVKTYFPQTEELETLLGQQGANGFYHSVENRISCCAVRKINPLKRALQDIDIWITGLRSGQSNNRQTMAMIEYDPNFEVIKYNPLINWSLDEVQTFIKAHDIPQNKLHDQGYLSIGCAPCTRAIEPGEDIRAGRWWWEQSKKECGLHR